MLFVVINLLVYGCEDGVVDSEKIMRLDGLFFFKHALKKIDVFSAK